jgi:hypothetical protein
LEGASLRQFVTVMIGVLIPGVGATLVALLSLAGVAHVQGLTKFWDWTLLVGGACFLFLAFRGIQIYGRTG